MHLTNLLFGPKRSNRSFDSDTHQQGAARRVRDHASPGDVADVERIKRIFEDAKLAADEVIGGRAIFAFNWALQSRRDGTSEAGSGE